MIFCQLPWAEPEETETGPTPHWEQRRTLLSGPERVCGGHDSGLTGRQRGPGESSCFPGLWERKALHREYYPPPHVPREPQAAGCRPGRYRLFLGGSVSRGAGCVQSEAGRPPAVEMWPALLTQRFLSSSRALVGSPPTPDSPGDPAGLE